MSLRFGAAAAAAAGVSSDQADCSGRLGQLRAAEIVRRHAEPGAEVTTSPAELAVRFRTAKSEAKNAFGSDELIIEKAVADKELFLHAYHQTQARVLTAPRTSEVGLPR